MNIVLTLNELNLITDFYRKLNILSEDIMKNIIMNLNSNKIIVAHIENKEITTMITANLIKNNYYLERFLYLKYKNEEIQDLLKFLIESLKSDSASLRVLCDNYPYDESTDYMLLSSGFKYNYIDYLSEPSNNRIDSINYKFAINDKSNDVIEYLLRQIIDTNEKTSKYLNIEPKEDIPQLNVENTNLAVIRDSNNLVIGVTSFTIVGDNMFIHSIYGDNDEVLDKLIRLIKSITARPIEIGVMPVRTELISFLDRYGFMRNQADYFRNIGEV